MKESASDQAGLHAESITVAYPSCADPVVVGQTFDIPLGVISALIGPNGSGKSTMLKAMAKQLCPSSGRVMLDGADLAHVSARHIACKLGILFQENIAPNDLTVEELTYYGRYPHHRLFDSLTAADHEAVEKALHLSGASKLRNHRVSQLSSGQKQLAWLALLLAQSPQYLLLDEPTTYLDLAHQFEVMEMVRNINRQLGCTVVVSVHDLNLAAQYVDHIFVMMDGKIIATGAPQEVLTPMTLREVFGVEMRVFRDAESGVLCCLPLRCREV